MSTHSNSIDTAESNSPLQYKKSSFCAGGGCIEVGRTENAVFIRDSKDHRLTPLKFSLEEWQAFTKGVKAGEFKTDN